MTKLMTISMKKPMIQLTNIMILWKKFPMMKLVNYTLTLWLHDGGVAVCLRVPVEVDGKGFRFGVIPSAECFRN